MKCQILFSWKNKKKISICRLLKILHRLISANKIDNLRFVFFFFFFFFFHRTVSYSCRATGTRRFCCSGYTGSDCRTRKSTSRKDAYIILTPF